VLPVIMVTASTTEMTMVIEGAPVIRSRSPSTTMSFWPGSVAPADQAVPRHDRGAVRRVGRAEPNAEDRVEAQVLELEQTRKLRRFLSPQVADAIVSSGDDSILRSHRRNVAMLFADLRGWTTFSTRSSRRG